MPSFFILNKEMINMTNKLIVAVKKQVQIANSCFLHIEDIAPA
jgi:hypothetical protein